MDKIEIPNEVLLEEVRSLLDEGREVVLMTKGSSMLPHIRGGKDSVRLVKPEGLNVGDIALARVPVKGYVLHRIIAMNGDEVTLMGDGNIVGTEICTRGDVFGIATHAIGPMGRERRLGKGRLWVRLLPYRRFLLRCHKLPRWIIKKLHLLGK